MGICGEYPNNTFAFFLLSLLSGIFVLLKRTQGWTKPESVLFDHFSAVFLFIGVYFNVQRCSEEKKNQDVDK